MLGDKRLGILLYFSEIISALLFLLPIKCESSNILGERKETNIKDVFFDSIEKAITSILKICTIICFFSGILALVSKYTNNVTSLVFSLTLEISNGAAACAALFYRNPPISIALLAFLCNWAGICVHMQVFSAQKSIKVKYYPFLLSKLLQGILSSVIAIAGYKIFFCT